MQQWPMSLLLMQLQLPIDEINNKGLSCANKFLYIHLRICVRLGRDAASSKKMGGGTSNMAGMICPPPLGPNRVNCYPKTWEGPLPPTSVVSVEAYFSFTIEQKLEY